jgi:hypothetical protein
VSVEPGAERHTWKTRLAALEVALGSQPLEGLSDVLRLGEKILAEAIVDLKAESETFPDAVEDESEVAARLERVRELVAAAGTAWRFAGTAHGMRQPLGAWARRSRMAPSGGTGTAEGDIRSVASGRATILEAQGAYYIASGLWAVVDRQGFERVTGPKTDYWLVRTVGLLAAGIGLTLLLGARGGRPSSETRVLGVVAGASFAAVDLVYVARRRISPVYLADAGVHGLLAAYALSERSSQSRGSS